jgi:tetratricopeptide (TPR) repeat protein
MFIKVISRYLNILFVIVFLISSNKINSQNHHGGDSHGVVNFNISCTPASQSEFNQAMILLHHMTYPQAREMFQKLAAKDSACAMAEWGFAMTLFQPLWPTRPGPAELQQGWDAIQRAKSFGSLTEREDHLINAAEAFFQDPKSTDYWKRIQDWKVSMEIAYSSFPEDNEAAAFYALALLATIPPDKISSPNSAQAAEILLNILEENPDHPGAMHYLIHANDAPGRESKSLEILGKYKEVAPNNPHALHMPTHIYTRLGEWPEVISGNINAALAALQFPAGDKGQFIWDEFAHAIEYLIYAYLQMGNDNEAAAQLKRLNETNNIEPTFKTAFHLSSTRARYTLERKAWNEAAQIDPRAVKTIDWDRFPWPEAIGWFARGLGSVHTGDSIEAKKALQHLTELQNITMTKKEILFARNIQVLHIELSAMIVNEEGLHDSAIILLTQAAELESATPKHAVTPAPTIPAYELLGDLLFANGKFNEALTAYKSSLENYPKRFNTLLGAARASIALEDKSTALSFYQQLIDVSDSKSGRDGLKEAKAFVAK